MSKHSPSNSIPWRALLLGAVMGYIMAAMTNAGGGSSGHLGRFLHEKAEPGEKVGPNHGPEEEVETHHGLGEEEEEEEEEVNMAVLDLAIAVIVLFLIVLTILFEVFKEGIEETAEASMHPVIEGLFGELTVLGFLSVITFCVTKLGWFEKLNEHFFEEESELLEIFESVHYMLFFIMVFFVINVLVLMYGGKVMNKTWWIYNRACRDKEYMAKLDAALESKGETDNTESFFKFLCQALFPCRSQKERLRSELKTFHGLREEFIAERSLDPPFAPNSSNKVEEDFDFGRYLALCQAHSLAHMVHLSNATWIFMAAMTVFFYGVALFVDYKVEPYAWIWAASAWIMFLASTYFDFHMIQVINRMVPCFVPQQKNGEDSALLSTKALPNWTTVDLEKYIEERPLLARMTASKNRKPNRQETLYWVERQGPRACNIMFQIRMLFTSAYVSLLCLTLLPSMMWVSEQSIEERIIYPIVSLLPVYLLLSRYQVAAANLTMATSVGVFAHPQCVAEVSQAVKTDDLIQSFVFLQRLEHGAKTGFQGLASKYGAKKSTLSSGEISDAEVRFAVFDTSRDGKISSDELGEFMKKINIMVTEDALAAMVYALDKDESGDISMDEFLDFYRTHVAVELDDEGVRKLACEMFEDMDIDGSGEITLAEFKKIIDSYNVGMSVNEIGDVLAELDEKNTGKISEHEFVHLLLVKHRRLFDRTPLPSLE